MKIGLSSYSLSQAIFNGSKSIVDIVYWVAEHGGEHIELVPIGFDLIKNPELIPEIRRAAHEAGITISNYAVAANFIQDSDEGFEAEIAHVKQQVDIARSLGVRFMRHDVASRPIEQTSIQQFERDLPSLVTACRRIADYAQQFGITTSVENHGYYIQAADRIQRLVHEVDRANFKTTLDTGNFLCVDENPIVSVRKNIDIASMIHIKDFYIRTSRESPGEGWFHTAGGNHLRGAIAGHGDIDLKSVLSIIKNSGYNGYVSIEFEGLEDCELASRVSLENVRNMWERL